jgi:hypothetical protein
LNNSKELQSQLVLYFTNDRKDKINPLINFNEAVKEEAFDYQEALEALNLEEPDYERWENKYDRYYESWEIEQEAAEGEVNELFDRFKAELLSLTTEGEVNKLMAKFTGLLIACHKADIQDEYCTLGDSQEYFSTCLEGIAKDIEVELNKTILNSKSVIETIKETLHCFLSGEANLFSTAIHDSIMLCLVTNNTESIPEIYAEFSKYDQTTALFPNTYLEAIRIANPSSWISEAERLSPFNATVARSLLQQQAISDHIAFHKNAKILFPIFKNELIDLILNRIDDEYDPEFSKEVLFAKLDSFSRKIEDYIRLAKLLTPDEKQQFIEKLKNDFSHKFCIEVLEEEKMYEEILEYARDRTCKLSDYITIMRSIIQLYPERCFEIANPKIKKLLETQMGRDYYHEVAIMLQFLATNKDNSESIRNLVLDITMLYSRRPALKDELRKVGLMK